MRYQSPPKWLRAALAGLLVAASLPPWGWWPLGLAGAAVLVTALDGEPWKRRVGAGAVFGLAQFAVGLWWMHEFTLPGYILCTLLQASFFAGGAALVQPRRIWTVPAALVIAEAARGHWPLGGLPLGGAALGQVGGPLAPVARIGGELLLVGVIGVVGVALVWFARRRWSPAVGATALIMLVAVGGAISPSGQRNGTIRVAAVQGGGTRGLRAIHRETTDAFEAQVRATHRVRPPVDVVLWPEDVVDVDAIEGAPEATAIGDLARSLGATVIAGVVEDDGVTRFRNAALAWDRSGTIAGRYDKVHRVPFGEYIPLRWLVRHLGNVDAVPRDATAGKGPGILPTPAGRAGVAISYEVFFADRARAAARAGGQVLLVPTNASSFTTSQVPGQELAAARLRAIETGRWTVQSAPTGYSAIVDHAGNVRQRTALGHPAVLHATVTLRTGSTPAVTLGAWPFVLAAAVAIVVSRRTRQPANAAQ
jgi:apolipoprotein N-acyltransferase